MEAKEIYLNLKNVALMIYKLYRKLAVLEYNNLTNSEEYNKTIESLKTFITIENMYLNEIKKANSSEFALEISCYAAIDMCGTTPPKKLIHDTSYIIFNKIKENDIACMRVSARVEDIYLHNFMKFGDEINIYDISIPKRDKYFLTILSDQINDDENKAYRGMLIDAKYDYAFVNCKEASENVEDEVLSQATVIKNSSELIEYAQKFSKLSRASILSPANSRKFVLGMNYIRANLLQMSEEDIESFKNIIFALSAMKEIGENDGHFLFLTLLNYSREDRKKYINDGFSFKRRF